jgi:Raf kinase inhibitor-like YbhB/YbcL family protein
MAQDHQPQHSGAAITIQKVTPREPSGITVFTRSQDTEGRLADRHSAYHDNISPPLEWTEVIGAQSYALIVEDPDAPRELPFVHWLIWNIPGELTALPEGLPNDARLITPQDAVQGRNGSGGHGWFGPLPPRGHGVHRYYFQLFALDAPLQMGPETTLDELLNALKAHTIADGETMATYEAPSTQ